MGYYYNIDEIINDLGKELAFAAAYRDAWNNVTFPTKKDGTPFTNIARNINGAVYDPYNNNLHVCVNVNYTYRTDYTYIDNDAGELENIKKAVADRIKQLDKKIASLNEQIKNIKADFETLENAYIKYQETKNELYKKYSDSTGFYAVESLTENRHKYDYMHK